MKHLVTWFIPALGLSAVLGHAQSAGTDKEEQPVGLSSQYVFVDPNSFAVLPEDFAFRTDSFVDLFNPTSTTPPFFQIFDPAFLQIIGRHSSIRLIARNDTFAFAHEAPIYVPETDEVFFASNDGGPLGMSDLNRNNGVFKISLKEVEEKLKEVPGTGPINVDVTQVTLPESIQMTNGGTGPYKGNLVLINSGRGPRPPSIALVNPKPPHNVTVLLNNYYGRQFNSLNDIKIHPKTGKMFFTDVPYGFLNHFRDAPLLPNQVYRFDPETGKVRTVAADLNKPNGIAFDKEGRIAYIADTGAAGGFLGNNFTNPTTVYAFDVDERSGVFKNRRVLAFVDAGVPDGVQVDLQGNVYTACGDGVQVFASDGTLLGKFFTGETSANMVFAAPDRLVILSETKVYIARVAVQGVV